MNREEHLSKNFIIKIVVYGSCAILFMIPFTIYMLSGIDEKKVSIPKTIFLESEESDATSDIGKLTREEIMERLKKVQEELEKKKEQVNKNTEGATESYQKATELANSFLEKTYPVGSIYVSYNNTNPGELFGGTWEVYGAGKFLKGTSSGPAGVTGGNNTVTLTTANLPSHTHSIPALSGTAASSGAHTHSITATAASNGAHTHDSITSGVAASKTLSGYAEFRTATDDHNIILTVSGAFTKSHIAWTGTHARMFGTNKSNYVKNRLTINASHSHTVTGTANSNGAHTHTVTGSAASAGEHTHNVTTNANNTGTTGTGTAFNVENEYITVYMWRRTD